MNNEDIIRMAREAGFPFNKYGLLQGDDDNEIDADAMFERFAALVAAAERERIIAANAPEIEAVNAHIKALEDAVSSEREACAKVCDELAARDKLSNYYKIAANAIRARNNHD